MNKYKFFLKKNGDLQRSLSWSMAKEVLIDHIEYNVLDATFFDEEELYKQNLEIQMRATLLKVRGEPNVFLLQDNGISVTRFSSPAHILGYLTFCEVHTAVKDEQGVYHVLPGSEVILYDVLHTVGQQSNVRVNRFSTIEDTLSVTYDDTITTQIEN